MKKQEKNAKKLKMILMACLMTSLMTGCQTTANECSWTDKISMCDSDIKNASRQLKESIKNHNQSGAEFCNWKFTDKEPIGCD